MGGRTSADLSAQAVPPLIYVNDLRQCAADREAEFIASTSPREQRRRLWIMFPDSEQPELL